MLKFVKRAVVVSALFSAGIVSAGEVIASGGFVVTGVIKPTACSIVFEGGDIINYGNIDRKNLDGKKGYYAMTKADVKPFSVTCEKPTPVSIKFVDAKADSVAQAGDDHFGLGVTTDNQKIGYHFFSLKDNKLEVTNESGPVLDVVYGKSLTGGKEGWGKETGTYVSAGHFYTPINKKTLSPVPFTVFKSAVGSHIRIDKTLKVNDEEKLDGYVTMELRYI